MRDQTFSERHALLLGLLYVTVMFFAIILFAVLYVTFVDGDSLGPHCDPRTGDCPVPGEDF